ncbi:helix-turn-helix domain-containing protein [Streptantibioticus cattleyicolor]|uniref:Putative transcriptional regulator, XRE family n=1 Tax=Streptantibioticus cattleyicolor (strain ATCC 35852 / DSM 46488 / JCM 4925 / NBRC 14057 / NRRL 8057) TaxID=1003195 RepID=F8JL45_STREN|nr:helix-turn-helix transcriptional regulator [Streptantibioticus cattleyicolor]AEW98376.1 putative transcriptional regulator, XRE family [Streptantibioticus cattleyicolor NRRL 8057 = DSM 46488]CCB72565.1 Helix-turn-helix protein [Streptantibioticus cattleyicolor NRRL 8057 = DSM 46488]
MADEPNQLGDYVRARRALVTPQEAGIPVTGVRRVPGLRREEVAMLAGISADYYLRLEQGRDRNPSVQVLESIARVLRLDEDATAYLLRLGAARPWGQRRRPREETVPAGVAKLVAALPFPAFVEGRYLDILAANALATALSPRLVVGNNRLRDAFLDPAERTLHPDWESATANMVAGFRESVGTDTDDPRFIELVGELSLASPLFSRLWARHDVDACEGAAIRVDHPQIGPVRLNRERLGVGATASGKLVVYHPDPGTDSAERLALLAATLPPPTAPSATPAASRH